MTGELAAAGGFFALGVLLALGAIAGVITLLSARSRRADRRDSTLASLASLFDAPDPGDPFGERPAANGELEETQPHPRSMAASELIGPPKQLAPSGPVAAPEQLTPSELTGAPEQLAPTGPSAPPRPAVRPAPAPAAFVVPDMASLWEQEGPVEATEAPRKEVAASMWAADPAMRLETISDRELIDRPANAPVEREIEEGAFRRALLVPPRLVVGVSAAVADRLSRLRRPPSGAPQPADWDYEPVKRRFGLQERIGPLLVAGLVVLAAVIILGVWLVAAHHGANTPVPAPRIPNPGPLGPQGSLPP
jgi:hypothetical protein